ncbi:glycerol-3-phosphate cytidylyltransferase [Pseudomonas putida]|uniref:glycerol-3-phosphate cytidylyltransferase n=1 Tax=Pseudomonas putida TaxID=303 RepID=UPI0010E00B44|nr:glycerol-3-phosphate cytidylyltransferase [Pseudomonas putida]TCP78305.1 glycerol-3-phosphate cytidylyltransferase [Pseudomonas putida]
MDDEMSPTGKTVITYGTFDLFHIGHVHLLKNAKALGSKLIVAVSHDSFNEQKGKSAFSSYDDRSIIVSSCKYVDMVIPELNWEQKRQDIIKYNVDIFTIGDDWRGEFDFLKDLCEVVYLPRTPGISSSQIKQHLNTDSLHIEQAAHHQ